MATGCIDEDEVPPLEDLSEIIGQLKTLGRDQVKKDSVSCGELHHDDQASDDRLNNTSDIPQQENEESHKLTESDRKPDLNNDRDVKACGRSQQPIKSSKQTFGGFQKGFLNKKKTNQSNGTSQGNEVKSSAKKDDEIPTIQPKNPATNDLEIPEVQDAMKTPLSFLQNKDWITDDFLKKIEGRPDLLKKLLDPKYSQALSHFSSNPQEAWKRLGDNKELQEFIKELCGVLGEQFTAMADKAEQNKSEVDGKDTENSAATKSDQEQMAKILSDPETLEVLKDPWISKLVTNLKENPPEARRMLARSKPEVLPKIKKLIDAGILSYG